MTHPIEHTKPILIGIASHAPCSGKTTLADILQSEYGFIKEPFAGPLKELAFQVLTSSGADPIDAHRYLYQDKATVIPHLGVTARHLLQTLGTDWGRRQINQRLWLLCWHHNYKILSETFNFLPQQPLLIVVDDVRFPNEADLIRSLGGEVWQIIRPGVPSCYPLPNWLGWMKRFLPRSWRTRLHSSEVRLRRYPHFTRTIFNNGTLADLRATIDLISSEGFLLNDLSEPKDKTFTHHFSWN